MSPRVSLKRAFLAASAALFATAPVAHAQTLWSGPNTGADLSWHSSANWTGGVVPNGSSAFADLRLDWTGSSNSIALGSAVTVNQLFYDDTGSSSDVNLTIGNGGTSSNTLTFDGTAPTLNVTGATLTISAVVAGSFSKTGAGALVLSGNNSGLTALTVSAGTLRLGTSSAVGSAALTFSGGVLSSSTTTSRSIANAFTISGNFTLGNATNSGALTLSGNGSLGGATRTLTVASDVTMSGNLSNGSLAKAGEGLLVLSGDNTSLTAFTINRNSGIVRVTSAAALGGASTTITLNKEQAAESGQLQLATTGTHTFNQTWGGFKSAGALGAGGSAHIRNNSGNNTISGALNLSAAGGNGIVIESAGTSAGDLLTLSGNITSAVTSSRVHSIGGAGNGVISGIISNNSSTNTVGLEKSGAGTWTLTGANTFTGPVTILGGTLAVGSGLAAGTLGAGSSTVAISSSAFLQFNLTADRTHSGEISGAGSLVKQGSGALTLSGANSFTGGFTLTSGTVQIGANGALGGAAGTLALNGGALSSNSTAARTVTAAGASTLGGNLTLGNATNNGALAFANDFNLGGASRTLTVASDVTMSGVLSNGSLTKAGAGTLTLSGANTYNGTTLSAGTLRLSGGSNRLLATSTLTVGGAATLDLDGNAQSLTGLAFSDGQAASLTVLGGSALSMTGATNVQVGPGGTVAAGNSASLDLSALASFTYSNSGATGVFRIAPKSGGSNSASLGQLSYAKLSPSNSFTVANFTVGDVGLSNDGGISVLELGAANVVNADAVNFGYSGRSDVSVGFIAGLSSPTLTLRGRDGTSALASLRIGNIAHFTSGTWTTSVDLSAGVLDANVTTVWIGSADVSTQTGRGGTGFATLALGQGTLRAGTLVIGRSAFTTGTSGGSLSTRGTLTLGHANGTVDADTVTLADGVLTGTSVTGILNLEEGTLRAGVIQKGGNTGTTTSGTLNLTSGIVGNRPGSDLTIGSGLAIKLLGSGVVLDAAGASNGITVASAITGDFGFAKTGAGTLTLTAANTFNGVLALSEGALALGAGGSVAASAVIDLAAGTRLSTAAGNALAAGTVRIGGAGAIGSAQLGDFTLAGGTVAFDVSSVSSLDQLTLVAGSTLALTSGTFAFNRLAGTLANGDYDLVDYSAGSFSGSLSGIVMTGLISGTSRQSSSLVATGSKIRLSVTGSAADLTWGGGQSGVWRVRDPLDPLSNWTSAGPVEEGTLADEFYQGDNVAFAGAGAGTVTVTAALTAGTVSVSGDSNYAFSGAGSLSAGSLAKSGGGTASFGVTVSTLLGATVSAGELEFAAAGANATSVAVSGGTLRLSGSASAGDVTLSSGTVVIASAASPASLTTTGGTVILGGVNSLGGGAVSMSSTRLEIAASGAFEKAFSTLSNSTMAITGAGSAVTRAAELLPASGALTLEVTQADASLLLSAAHGGSGDLALTKTGAGALKLTAANTVGSVTVSAGTLFLGDNTAAGSVSGTVSVASGATLRIHGSGTSIASQGSGAISGQGSVEWVGNNTGTGNLGSGSYTLGTANAHSGLTRLSGARANVSNASAFGTSGVEIGAAGQVFYTVSATPLANDVRITSGNGWGDTGSVGTFGAIRLGNNTSMSGAIVLAADGIRISGNNSTFSGVISEEGGSRGLQVHNPSFSTAQNPITLSGANTFSGPVTVNRYALSVASLNSVVGGVAASNLGAPTTAEAGVITLGTPTTGAELIYTGSGETTDRVVHIAAVGTASSTLSANGSGLLRFTSAFTVAAGANRSLALAGTGSGQIDGALSGAEGFTLALTKSGAGTWTLLGVNTLAGGVTVTGGTLNLTGDNTLDSLTQSGASSLTLLSGANTFSGAVTIDAGTLVLGSADALSGATLLGLRDATLRSSDATARTVTQALSFNNHVTFGSADTGDLLLTGSGNLGSIAKNLTVANAVTEISGVLFRTSGTATTLKLGAGKLILSGENTYTGTLEVRAGEVELAGAGKLGAAASGLTLSGGSLDLGGTSQSIGAVSISAAAVSGDTLFGGSLTGSSYAVSNTTGTVTISANLGTGTLTKSGNGVLVLSGANSLTGLTLSGGSTQLGGASHTVAGAVSITAAAASGDTLSDGTLTGSSYAVSNASGIVLLSASLGAGALAKSGAGELVLSGDNALTSVSLSAGTLRIGSNSALGSGSLTLSAGTLTSASADARNLSHSLTLAGNVTLGSATPSVGGALTFAGAGDLGGGARTLTVLSSATFTGVLSNGSLTKAGAGTLVLSGSNSLTAITVANSGGTLRVTNLEALGAATLNLNKAGTSSGTLELALSGTNTIANAWGGFSSSNSASGGTPGVATLRNVSGDNTVTGLLNLTNTGGSGINIESSGTSSGDRLVLAGGLGSTVSSARTHTLFGDGNGLVSGDITNAGAGDVHLFKDGSGTWTLSGTNLYRGATTVFQGTLVAASSSALGTVAAGSEVKSGATLALLGTLTIGAEALSLRGVGHADAGALRSSGGDSTYGGAVTLAEASTVHVADNLLALTGAIGGAFALTKAGAGTLLLSGNNTFSGGTLVSAGTLRLGSDTALGTGAVSVASGATLDLNGRTLSNALTLASGAYLTGGTLSVASGTLDLSSGVPQGDATLAVASGGTLAFGTSAYAGNVAYTGGAITGSGFTGYADIATEGVSLGSSLAAGTVRLKSGGAAVIGQGFARDIRFEGGRLGGLNTAGYTGTVTVASGATLDIDGEGDIAFTGAAFSVLAGATLKGSATFASQVTVNGTLAPGNSPGLMTYESGLSFGSTAVLDWEFDGGLEIVATQEDLDAARGTSYDALNVTGGSLVIASGATLAITPPENHDYSGLFWDTPRLFSVIAASEGVGITGQFVFANDTATLSVGGEGRWDILSSFSETSGIYLQWTPVPEPSTYGLALGALALAGAALRRRKKD